MINVRTKDPLYAACHTYAGYRAEIDISACRCNCPPLPVIVIIDSAAGGVTHMSGTVPSEGGRPGVQAMSVRITL